MIKKVIAKSVKDSRGELTIQVIVKTSKGKFKTSAPCGKSKGRYEIRPYFRNLKIDIRYINNLEIDKLNNIIKKKSDNRGLRVSQAFLVLKDIEKLVKNKIGANTLFALEASLLKALARENGKELWEFLGRRKVKIRSVGNAVGGGMHSRGVGGKKPDFQEFLFISDIKTNKIAYGLVGRLLRANQRNDEGAWETSLSNEEVLGVMEEVRDKLRKRNLKVDIGIDAAGSSFYRNGGYVYKNPAQKLSKSEQIDYVRGLIKKYNIYYIEDGLNENDFSGFAKLRRKVRDCLIVGDDLIVTNPERLGGAIKFRAINGVIVKPNQIGSLLKVREVIDLAKKYKIKTVMSHRSGETKDNTIADLAVGFGCDFIKAGIYGSVRESKLKRLMKILKGL